MLFGIALVGACLRSRRPERLEEVWLCRNGGDQVAKQPWIPDGGSRETRCEDPARGCLSGKHPEESLTSPSGFSLIAGLHQELQDYHDTDIVVDFSWIAWVDGHLTASLDAVFRQAGARGNMVQLTALEPRLRDTFCKNRLIFERKLDRFHTAMQVTPFGLSEG